MILRRIIIACLSTFILLGPVDAQQGYDAGGRARVNVGASYALLTAAAASGPVTSGAAGGTYVLDIRGTFGGTSAALQVSNADGTFSTIIGGTITTAGSYGPFAIPAGASVKIVLTGGSPSGLYAKLSSTG